VKGLTLHALLPLIPLFGAMLPPLALRGGRTACALALEE
jgi:hypothetical protein